MVNILDSEVDLGGRCLDVAYVASAISEQGSATVHMYCYADSQLDF